MPPPDCQDPLAPKGEGVAEIKAAAVLLAAGLSRRMGERNKLLIEIEGEPLVRRTAKAYLAAGVEVHVVLGHEAEQVRAVLQDLAIAFVHNPDYAEGQPTSVRAGIDGLPAGHTAILVALADQAALTADDIRGLLNAFAAGGGNCILVPYYQGRRGNPVVFPASLVREMRSQGRNAASRGFIDGNPELVYRYEAPNDHTVIDVDTPDDVIAFETRLRREIP
jgi:molybdenum cofactor cytidylyltransferase